MRIRKVADIHSSRSGQAFTKMSYKHTHGHIKVYVHTFEKYETDTQQIGTVVLKMTFAM